MGYVCATEDKKVKCSAGVERRNRKDRQTGRQRETDRETDKEREKKDEKT